MEISEDKWRHLADLAEIDILGLRPDFNQTTDGIDRQPKALTLIALLVM